MNQILEFINTLSEDDNLPLNTSLPIAIKIGIHSFQFHGFSGCRRDLFRFPTANIENSYSCVMLNPCSSDSCNEKITRLSDRLGVDPDIFSEKNVESLIATVRDSEKIKNRLSASSNLKEYVTALDYYLSVEPTINQRILTIRFSHCRILENRQGTWVYTRVTGPPHRYLECMIEGLYACTPFWIT